MFDVIITCSGLGSRLSPITDYLNKALIKVGDEPIISKIINSYPKDCRFIITLGHLKEQLIDYLSICHKDINFKFVEVDDYSSDQSSLLYSLSKTFDLIDKPFYYNACDTYIEQFEYFGDNNAIIAKTFIGNQYRRVTYTIEDTPAQAGELCYTGVCYIAEFNKFKEIAIQILKNKTSNLSDAHVLKSMYMNFYETSSWYDIGNFISLDHTNNKFENRICVLNKEHQETYLCNNKIVKFFSDESKVKKLFNRHKELKKCVPICGMKDNFIYYDYIEGLTLSTILTPDLLNKFLSWCEENLWVNCRKSLSSNFFDDFYVNKASERAWLFLNKHSNVSLDSQEINFRKVDNIYNLLNNIPDFYKNKTIGCLTHGDLVFENVIVTNDGFTLIDWREGFLTKTGDKLYDIAKMKHNLIFNHTIVKKENYFLKTEDNQCLFDPNISQNNILLIKQLNNWCISKKIDPQLIDLIVSLIQISSSGVHTGREASLLFYMGWYNLNKALNG